MKQKSITRFAAFFLLILIVQSLPAQIQLNGNRMGVKRNILQENALYMKTTISSTSTTGKGYAHYTVQDWRRLIDSTWGPGLSTDQKLQIFDGFWDNVNKYYGGFPNLGLNWDSIKALYRPEVAQGVSRGRFAGIMSNLTLALLDGHTLIIDNGIDSLCFVGTPWQSYRPRGVPVLRISGSRAWGMGATITPTLDSALLVIEVVPHQPLGLEAGDIVLGYDGVPWKQLIKQLLDAQLPVSSLNYGLSMWGASQESMTHQLLSSVGANWHLFDSLDVVKYSTGDTVHLPTWKLDNTDWDLTFGYFEQLPVKGVPRVEALSGGPQCTWGIVEGTNVGYIYINDWYSTKSLVDSAIKELTVLRKTDGLVIDFRANGGGNLSLVSELGGLFNNDPWVWSSIASRNSTTDKLSFNISALSYSIPPKPSFYDQPIAVLTGPECGSIGDWGAFFMRSHPMVRFFGKPTSTAYTLGVIEADYLNGLWYYGYATSGAYSNYPGEGHLIHKGFEVDEKVWFTRNGVANGIDDVVKRALEWISTLTYSHNVALDHNFVAPEQGNLNITALLTNPLNHSVTLSAIITDVSGTLRDSVLFYNDGMHDDGSAEDSLWGCNIKAPSDENMFSVSVRADDNTNVTFRRLPNAVRFTTAGPLIVDSLSIGTASNYKYTFKPFIKNAGKTLSIQNIIVRIISNDPWVTSIFPVQKNYPNLLPGDIKSNPTAFAVTYDPTTFKGYFNLTFSISSNGWVYWETDTTLYIGPVSVEENKVIPTEYSLAQNFPNPFNPSTAISFTIGTGQLSAYSYTTLKVYDVLGNEVATLVNEEKPAGNYLVTWNASNLSSGVYFYQLKAGSFVKTKKLILMK